MSSARVALLKGHGWRTDQLTSGIAGLPYRLDLLGAEGFDLLLNDALWRWPLASRIGRAALRRTKPYGAPFVETAAFVRDLRRADVCLAMWETEGTIVSLARSTDWLRRVAPPVVLFCCWLAQTALDARADDLPALRRRYRGVDRFITLSPNQPAILSDRLDIDPAKIDVVDFGVDDEFFFPVEVPDGGFVLAVGRDKSRDWRTSLEAITDAGLPARVAGPRSLVRTAPRSDRVESLGVVDRWTYRALLARARLVVVSVEDTAYPSGQSVLLEAMMMGKCCVVTRTAALQSYVDDGRTAVFTRPGDATGLRETLCRLWEHEPEREAIGRQARQLALQRYRAARMWGAVAESLRSAIT